MKLTTLKLSKVNDLLKVPENLTSYLNINVPNLQEINIHSFKSCKDKFCFRKIEITYEYEMKYYHSIIIRIDLDKCTPNNLKYLYNRKTFDYKDFCIKARKLAPSGGPFVYINTVTSQLDNVDELLKIPITKRITLDIAYDHYNEEEVQELTDKTLGEIITFDTRYDNIDFCNAMNRDTFETDAFCNITVDAKDFDNNQLVHNDETIVVSEYKQVIDVHKLRDFIYQPHVGCKKAWYGYTSYDYDNYIVILKQDEKYMFVHYCEDDASCAGYFITFTNRIYDSPDELWASLEEFEKCLLITANLKFL